MDETIEVIKGQRDSLKRKLDAQNRWAIRSAALALFVLGIVLFVLWFALEYTANNYDTAAMLDSISGMSMLLLLASVAVIALAVLWYDLSPARFLRAEVADALALSGVANIEKLLASLLIESRGVYVPAAQAGSTRLFIPVSGETDPSVLRQASGGIFVTPGEGAGGILLEPPGYRLLAYVREIGATFTDEGLENEMKDALENSLELAGRVTFRREGDGIFVSLGDLANEGMCAAVRKENPGICTQTGCPVCSLVACMITEGTGLPVRIAQASVKNGTVSAVFQLIQEQ
jgi:hypothetical protein